MADQQAAPTITAPFPAPPPFWKHFTTENISRLEAIIEAHYTQTTSTTSDEPSNASAPATAKKVSTTADTLPPSELRALEGVPNELSYLIPPAPPAGENYTVFNDTINLTPSLPPLSTQSIPQLFPSIGPTPNPAPHLLRLSKSLLLSFLESTSILSLNPGLVEQKLEDLQTIFLNVEHLINLYRPHQARETLVRDLEERVRVAREEVRRMEGWEKEVGRWVGEVEGRGRLGEEVRNGHGEERVKEGEEERRKRMWRLIREIENGEDEVDG